MLVTEKSQEVRRARTGGQPLSEQNRVLMFYLGELGYFKIRGLASKLNLIEILVTLDNLQLLGPWCLYLLFVESSAGLCFASLQMSSTKIVSEVDYTDLTEKLLELV